MPLTYTELRASAAGIITARNVEVGQVAQAAQSAYTLAEDGERDVVFDLYEFDLPPAAGKQRDQTRAAVGSGRDCARACAARFRPTVDPKTATVRVKVAIQNRRRQ